MYSNKFSPEQLRRSPLERRAYAFLVDFILIWIITSLITNLFVEFLAFCFLWFILRVVVVDRNRGQSLGRWAFDIRILDLRFNKMPSIVSLTKREGILCLSAFLAMIGLKISFGNFLSSVLLITPLILDVAIAIPDEKYNQAFHDRLSNTIIIQTQRGFSLDLRIKKIVKEIQINLQQKQRK